MTKPLLSNINELGWMWYDKTAISHQELHLAHDSLTMIISQQ